MNKPYDENLNYLLENRMAYLRSEIVRIIKSIDYVYGQTKIYPRFVEILSQTKSKSTSDLVQNVKL